MKKAFGLKDPGSVAYEVRGGGSGGACTIWEGVGGGGDYSIYAVFGCGCLSLRSVLKGVGKYHDFNSII